MDPGGIKHADSIVLMLVGILVFPDLLATTYFSDPKIVLPGMVVIAVGRTVIPLNRTGISLVRFCNFFFF